MPKEQFNSNPEHQNSTNLDNMSQLAEMPDFDQHMEQEAESPTLKYNSIEKVSKNFNQALIDMGLDENFAKSEALQRIIERARNDFIHNAANTSALNAPASFEKNSLQTDFVRNDHNYLNSITVNNPNQFTISTSEQYINNLEDAKENTHDVIDTSYTLQKNGWLHVDTHDASTRTRADNEQLLHNEHNTFNSQTFVHQEYNPNGREARMEAKTYIYNGEHLRKSYTTDTMLKQPNFMHNNANETPSSITRLERTGETTMHVFIEQDKDGKRMKYSAEETIDGEHGYQDLVLSKRS